MERISNLSKVLELKFRPRKSGFIVQAFNEMHKTDVIFLTPTCIHYLLLHAQQITPKLGGLKQQTFIFLTVSVVRNPQVELSWAFQLRVSHKSAVQALPGAPVT